MATIRAKVDCFGRKAKGWKKGETDSLAPGEKVPANWELVKAAPAAAKGLSAEEKDAKAKAEADAQAKADAAVIAAVVEKMPKKVREAYDALSPEEKAVKNKEFLDAAAKDAAK